MGCRVKKVVGERVRLIGQECVLGSCENGNGQVRGVREVRQ